MTIQAIIMGKNTGKGQIERILQTLKIIQDRRQGLSAADVNQLNSVDRRSTERDLKLLHDLGYIKKENHRYSIYKFIPYLNSNDAAIFMKIAQTHLKNMLPNFILDALEKTFQEADKKLNDLKHIDAKTKKKYAKWQDKIHVNFPIYNFKEPKYNAEFLHTIQDAIFNDHQLQGHYQGFSKETEKAVSLQPIGLIFKWPCIFVAALDNADKEYKRYALHRFSHVEKSNSFCDENIHTLKDFINSKQDYTYNNGPIALEIRYHDAWVLKLLKETPLSDNMFINEETHLISATVENCLELRSWLYSCHASIEILKPAPLRKEFSQNILKQASYYQ